MPNNRIFYACQAVQINGPSGTDAAANPSYDTIQGLQSVGMNTNFNLEPIYQLGQLDLYDNYEEIPEVEITLNKVLDGSNTIYGMAMGSGTLSATANNRCGVKLILYPDTNIAATGQATAAVECVPAYLSSVSYTFPTEGNFTEEVTIVSNDKSWVANVGTIAGAPENSGTTTIARRGMWSTASVLPTGSAGDMTVQSVSGGIPTGSKISQVSVSMNLGREQIRELGSRTPFVRYVNFPVQVTTEIQVVASTGDMVGVSGSSTTACNNPKALSDKEIVIKLCDGMQIDLGKKNKLTSVNYTGGDTGGGNATITYSYISYNNFTYTPPTGSTGYLTYAESAGD
jgi:hypothetical protein